MDIKPVLGSKNRPSHVSACFTGNHTEGLLAAADQACRKNLINGFNGNLSIRNNEYVLITCSGAAKAFLKPRDLCVLRLETGEKMEGRCRASSEAGMHLEIYRQQPQARAIVHTHPVALLSLTGARGISSLRDMNLFEASSLMEDLALIPDYRPGSTDLARAVGRASKEARAVFMSRHGLTCWGSTPEQALALSEELEALAAVRLNQLLLQACT
ncbi:MAG: class II aldolase/adducin family protein [Desulfonatronovibrionaceae bacterium]